MVQKEPVRSPQLTLDVIYRTDFSQVEVDQQQVNLTRFNLFFPEKREFFLENSGNFSFGEPIGRAFFVGGSRRSNLIPFFSRRIGLASDGTPIPIIGGARLSGKVGTYDVGLLTMKTEKYGSKPSNTFTVGLVKKNLFRSSWVGGIVTSRDSTVSGNYNRVYGVDGRFRFFERLELGSYLMRSETPGRSGRDQARQAGAGWRGDDFSVIASYHEVQENFNPEVGFIRRKNIRNMSGNFSWRPRPAHERIRNFILSGGIDYNADSRGNIETREQVGEVGILFATGAELSFEYEQTFERLTQPFHISGVLIPSGDYFGQDEFVFSYSSDRSRALSTRLVYRFGEFWNGRRKNFNPSVTFRPNRHLNIDLNYNRNGVNLPEGTFVTNLVSTRILYAFTTKIFLNAFLQYDSNAQQFNANVRFNIIHHPLSDLFIVYNDRRHTVSGNLLERALLFKYTHLFSF